jgi:hypothetical protein
MSIYFEIQFPQSTIKKLPLCIQEVSISPQPQNQFSDRVLRALLLPPSPLPTCAAHTLCFLFSTHLDVQTQ